MSDCVSTLYESNDISVTDLFLNTFQLLPEKHKKIWQLLRSYAIQYRQVFPSHSTIAKIVGCCRDTVIEAMKKFIQFGWIGIMKRCFRSNVYFIRDCLKKYDTRKDETFRLSPTPIPTEKPTVIPTLYNTYSSLENVRYTSNEKKSGIVQSSKDEKEHILRKIGITKQEDIFCLSRFTYHTLCKAYEDLTTRWNKSGSIHKLAAWITSRCKDYEPLYAKNNMVF